MKLDPKICYRALIARDPRFDGVFFVAVTTTRIYCRPVCPARTPGQLRCRFFPSAAAAEQAGFRPCLRCRPELAPGNAPVDSTSRVARALAARIESLATDETDLESIAAGFNLSSRQLRRIVRQHLGVSPIGLVQTHRLHLAKRLLTETRLRIVDVAFASGFGSVRRFNASFTGHYRMTPGRLRKNSGADDASARIRLFVGYRSPFAWDELLAFFAFRAWAGIEEITGQRYVRTAAIGSHRGWFSVEPASKKNYLVIEIAQSLVPVLPEILARVRRQFDLDARPDLIAQHLQDDLHIGSLVRALPGLRVPGGFCGFEVALRAILGQLVSVTAARTIGSRLTEAFGESIDAAPHALARLSPTPQRLAAVPAGDLAALGLTRQKAECIRALAEAVAGGELHLGPGPDPLAVVERLRRIGGIGDWTAQYIAMRALNWPDACPHGDLGLKKGLGVKTDSNVKQLAENWRPWRAYGSMYAWQLLARADAETKNHD